MHTVHREYYYYTTTLVVYIYAYYSRILYNIRLYLHVVCILSSRAEYIGVLLLY